MMKISVTNHTGEVCVSERDDVRAVSTGHDQDEARLIGWQVGHLGVTRISIRAYKGPMDWMPFVEVWRGSELIVAIPQWRTLCVEFGEACPRCAPLALVEPIR